jgi:GNAT superfamily N-acetyltransferase
MDVTARAATIGDIPHLIRLYRLLEEEMIRLDGFWPLAAGLPQPAADAFTGALATTGTSVLIGTIDRVPVGFLVGMREALVPQGNGALLGSIRYIFTEQDAREVGVAEAMMTAYLSRERAAGIGLFDAHVTPGHRSAKSFFEAKGFSTRSIVMHHADGEDR